ncbi:MAG TPA: DUF2383 domain-containing protein, partial [Agriterribacter sp.]|nr:DUF2383 domain-containing protein [Agriterribacter sp.]
MVRQNLNKIPGILHDLIQINEDRVLIYSQAVNQLKQEDENLAMIFNWFAGEANQFVRELNRAYRSVNRYPFIERSLSGKIYRMWMEVKPAFDQTRLKDILQLCEYC